MPNLDVGERPLLLDTHVWLWLFLDDPKARASHALPRMNRAMQDSRVGISVISAWEVGLLEAKGRISLPVSGREWLRQTLERPGVSLVPFSEELALDANDLPGDFHADPVDRILVATARRLGMDIVTADKKILAYAKKRYVHAVPL